MNHRNPAHTEASVPRGLNSAKRCVSINIGFSILSFTSIKRRIETFYLWPTCPFTLCSLAKAMISSASSTVVEMGFSMAMLSWFYGNSRTFVVGKCRRNNVDHIYQHESIWRWCRSACIRIRRLFFRHSPDFHRKSLLIRIFQTD